MRQITKHATQGLWFALVAALAVGCNTTTEGARGNVQFTPDECGRVGGCDFADTLGVGGLANVQIMGINGYSTAGVDLASDSPDVLAVTEVADVGGRPTWELYGMGPGVARLAAIESDGFEADFIEVVVQELAGLKMESFVGSAVGPEDDLDYDERWTVNADERVVLLVTPVGADGLDLMGRYEYVPLIEGEEFGSYINDQETLLEGTLDFTAPEGEYSVAFGDASGLSLSVVIQAVAAQN